MKRRKNVFVGTIVHIQKQNVRNCSFDYSFIFKFILQKVENIDKADCAEDKTTHCFPAPRWFILNYSKAIIAMF